MPQEQIQVQEEDTQEQQQQQQNEAEQAQAPDKQTAQNAVTKAKNASEPNIVQRPKMTITKRLRKATKPVKKSKAKAGVISKASEELRKKALKKGDTVYTPGAPAQRQAADYALKYKYFSRCNMKAIVNEFVKNSITTKDSSGQTVTLQIQAGARQALESAAAYHMQDIFEAASLITDARKAKTLSIIDFQTACRIMRVEYESNHNGTIKR